MQINKVIIAGILKADPEIHKTKNGISVTTVTLEVKREWEKDEETKSEVSDIEVDVFGRQADNLCQYMKKGSPVLFEGHLKLEKWQDKQSGEECGRLIVVSSNMQFLSTGEGKGGGNKVNKRAQSTAQRGEWDE